MLKYYVVAIEVTFIWDDLKGLTLNIECFTSVSTLKLNEEICDHEQPNPTYYVNWIRGLAH